MASDQDIVAVGIPTLGDLPAGWKQTADTPALTSFSTECEMLRGATPPLATRSSPAFARDRAEISGASDVFGSADDTRVALATFKSMATRDCVSALAEEEVSKSLPDGLIAYVSVLPFTNQSANADIAGYELAITIQLSGNRVTAFFDFVAGRVGRAVFSLAFVSIPGRLDAERDPLVQTIVTHLRTAQAL